MSKPNISTDRNAYKTSNNKENYNTLDRYASNLTSGNFNSSRKL